MSAFFIEPLYQRFAAVILFIVKVPVLSEQMQLVDPSVYTALRLLQSTFLSANLVAEIVKQTVTSTIRPTGTLEIMIPMANIKLSTAGFPMANPSPKRMPPRTTAKIVNLTMNLLIYIFKGNSSVLALVVKLAICPINVLSPVAKTIPFPVPCLFNVEKKIIFFVSKGLSSVH